MPEKKTIDSLNDSLEESIRNKSFQNLTLDIGEVLIDSIVDSEIIQDVPILKTIVNLGKIGSNVRDVFLMKKILAFLSQVNNPINKQNDELINIALERIKKDNSFFENLINRLDKSDELEKAKQIGKAFKHLLIEDLSILEFKLISNALNSINIDHLKYFLLDESRRKISEKERTVWVEYMRTINKKIYENQLLQSGLFLLTSKVIKKGDKFTIENTFEKSKIGECILEMNDGFGFNLTSIAPERLNFSGHEHKPKDISLTNSQ